MADRPADKPLKLVALDAEDLEVLSAHLQDFVVKVCDLAWLPREGRFAFVGNRIDLCDGGKPLRRRTAGHFNRVTKVSARGVDRSQSKTVLNLLAITFDSAEEPSGAVTLHFSGDALLRLEVECVEAQVVDLGPVWAASHAPAHDVEN